MDLAVIKAYEATAPRMPGVTLQQFAQSLADAVFHPVHVRGECVGAVVVKGCEIHACVLPAFKGQWFGKKHLAILAAVLKKYGVACTKATTDEGIAFVRRLGFRQFGDKWLKGLGNGD